MTEFDLNACYEGPERTVVFNGETSTVPALARRSDFRVPPGGAIHHACGNPRCLNPRHMQIVKVNENRGGRA